MSTEVAKRCLDVALASILLLALLPVMAITALVVWLESPGPILYRAERIGYRGRRLQVLKFRKMHEDASGLQLTVAGDARFTRLGAWLARTKLDELPQLWQVLRGELSMVGPRPEDRKFVALHASDYEQILSVRPGLTGLSQIAFVEESRILAPAAPIDHYLDGILPQKIVLDRMYVVERSLWLDLRIVLWTFAAVILRRQIAVHRETGKMNLRRRPRPEREAAGGLPEELLEWSDAR